MEFDSLAFTGFGGFICRNDSRHIRKEDSSHLGSLRKDLDNHRNVRNHGDHDRSNDDDGHDQTSRPANRK